jgi:putative DNA primase/helicase
VNDATALRLLAVKDEWFVDHLGGPLGTKDSIQALNGSWIIEITDLAHMRVSEYENIKAFISTQYDKYRPAFGHTPMMIGRSGVFYATSNNKEIFQDPTGNRRFWPVECEEDIDVEGHKRDRDQLWAEAKVQYDAGAKWWLETAELQMSATIAQDACRKIDSSLEIILRWC